MLKGTFTAIVTPFDRNGNIDYGTYSKLLDCQAKAGIDGIVPAGTTGESPTLTVEEHCRFVEKTVELCRGRMKVLAGTGANSTSEAVELTKRAKESGADYTLQVTPYYNKPNQEGLYRHFSTIADIGLPVILYNVPSRTSREITVETIARLSKHPNIVAIKEAGGSADRVSAILNACDIAVLSGDDALTLPMMAVGAKGVISVASNVIPEGVVKMVKLALEGKMEEALKLHKKYYQLFTDLFIDTNPIPVKTALGMMNMAEEVFRLPLCSMPEQLRLKLRETLKKLELVK